MSHKRIELALERQRLQLESARLRGELAAQAATQLALPFKALDLGLGALRWSRAHPLHLALAAGVLMVLKPRRTGRAALTAWRWWRSARRWYGVIVPWIPQRWRL